VSAASGPGAPGGEHEGPSFLEEVVKHVADPIFVKDRTHAWVWMNDAFCRLVGHPRDALVGKTDHDFFPASQAEWFHARDREAFRSGEQVTVEGEAITDADGHVHVLATTKVPLRGPGGEVTHLVGIIHDITKLKAVEEALRRANEELEQRVDERTRALREAQGALLRKERLVVLGQLSGGLAHQIRTPLATIANALAVLRRKLGGAPDPDVELLLGIVTEEIAGANRIITDLLDFARVRPPSSAPVAAARLVDAALAAVPAPRGVEIAREVDEGVVVHVDELQTRDALANVIRNALEAMGEAGRLTITVRAEAPHAVIGVADTGPGLDEHAQAHLFDPLVTSKPLGLGLGLTTARALVENQGGALTCAASSAAGARFEVRVPLAVE
jgi:PAS domain S-box-containing protein